MYNYYRLTLITTLIALTLVASSCKQSNDVTAPTTVTVVTPKIAEDIAEQLSKSVTNTALLVDEGIFGMATFQKFAESISGELYDGNRTYTPKVISVSDEAQFRDEARTHILDLLNHSKNDHFCASVATGADYHACVDILSRVTFVIPSEANHAGTITALFDDHQLATLEYTETQFKLRLILDSIPSVLTAMQNAFNTHHVSVDLPTVNSISGAVQLQLLRLNEDIQATLSTTALVSVDAIIDTKSVQLFVPAGTRIDAGYLRSTRVLQLAFEAGTSFITIGTTDVTIDSIAGGLTFNESTGSAQLNNIQFANAGVAVYDNSQLQGALATQQAVNATLYYYPDGFTALLNSPLEFNLSMSDGTTTWQADSGALFTFRGNKPVLVQNQPLTMTSTGKFGNGVFVAQPDTCFEGDIWQTVGCQAF